MTAEFRQADVSVVIPAYRATGTIGRALASVAAQTVRPCEAIVVDDGSDDDTAVVAESFKGRMAGIDLIVLRQDRRGAGAARNRALREAKGSVVAFLDADDEWLPAKLERSLAELNSGDSLFVSHNMIAVEPDGREFPLDSARHFRVAADPFVALFRRGFVATSTVVARRAAVMAAGGFDPALPAAQDYDLWLSLSRQPGAPFAVFPEALTRYHVNPGGITANTETRRRGSMDVLRRHAPALRGCGAVGHVLARIAIIHAEAMRAHTARGHVVAALGAAMNAVPSLVDGLLAMRGPEPPRPNFIDLPKLVAPNEAAAPARGGATNGLQIDTRGKRRQCVVSLLWFWVGAALLVYLLQFKTIAWQILSAIDNT